MSRPGFIGILKPDGVAVGVFGSVGGYIDRAFVEVRTQADAARFVEDDDFRASVVDADLDIEAVPLTHIENGMATGHPEDAAAGALPSWWSVYVFDPLRGWLTYETTGDGRERRWVESWRRDCDMPWTAPDGSELRETVGEAAWREIVPRVGLIVLERDELHRSWVEAVGLRSDHIEVVAASRADTLPSFMESSMYGGAELLTARVGGVNIWVRYYS